MALTKTKKNEVVDEISQLLADSRMTVVTAYQGTTVKALQQLRREARQNGTTLKVVKNRLIIKALQGKNATGIYHSQKRLIEIVHETFDRFFKKIQVHAIPFKESPAQKNVTPVWINKQMLDKAVSLKLMSEEMGIDKTQLSSLISADRPLSAPMKALFWYYFLSK